MFVGFAICEGLLLVRNDTIVSLDYETRENPRTRHLFKGLSADPPKPAGPNPTIYNLTTLLFIHPDISGFGVVSCKLTLITWISDGSESDSSEFPLPILS